MSTLQEARRRLVQLRQSLVALPAAEVIHDARRPLLDQLGEISELLEAIRESCRYCGAENTRAGDFHTDRCRAANARERSPEGTIKSSRHLARGRYSLVVHFDQPEAQRALRLLPGETVYIAKERQPGDDDE